MWQGAWLVAVVLAAVSLAGFGQEAAVPQPESQTQRMCDGFQDLTGSLQLGDLVTLTEGAAVVWDGAAYGVAWAAWNTTYSEVRFVRVAADGTNLIAPQVVVSGPQYLAYPSLAWMGSYYGLAWVDETAGDCNIWFARLGLDGQKAHEAVAVTTAPDDQILPSLVGNAGGWAVAWMDYRAGTGIPNVYFALLDADGNNLSGDLPVPSAASPDARFPSLVYNGSGYGVAWNEYGAPRARIYMALLNSAGANTSGDILVGSASGAQYNPSLVWTGTGYGVAWADMRNIGTAPDLYFSRVNTLGWVIDPAGIPVGTASGYQDHPTLAWTGAEYGVAWEDDRNWTTTQTDLYFSRISAQGAVGAESMAISNLGMDTASPRSLAFGTLGYGMAWELDAPISIQFAGFGCHQDSTPPSCPEMPAESGRTTPPSPSGHTMTMTWGASVDDETEMARYDIRKGGAHLDDTVSLTWTDRYFNPTEGAIYTIRAINAAGIPSRGCATVDTGDDVLPTCPGNLLGTVQSSPSQVTLCWLPASDVKSGLWKYRVYRNNTPLSGGEVLAGTTTYTDTTVASGVTYNYAVSSLDWAANEQTACQSLWVSTAPILLMVAKGADGVNAKLDWTNVNLNEYVVYRSTSPQAASELKRVPANTTTDPVLQDGVRTWYYFIQQREP